MKPEVSGKVLGAAVQRFTAKAESTSLYLLEAIDQTVESCRTMSDMLRGDMAEAERLRGLVERLQPGRVEIDPDDIADAGMAKLLDSLRKLHSLLSAKREAARRAPELGEYRDNVVDCYDDAINDAEHTFEAISELRTAVREHDADFGEPSQVYRSVDELLASLKA